MTKFWCEYVFHFSTNEDSFIIVIDIFHREEIKENKKQVYPACLPRTNDQYFGSSRLWVAGWGLVRQRRLRNVRSWRNFLKISHASLTTYVSQGNVQEVRGLQNTPRHVDVPVTRCSDPDNFNYPKGLICAGEDCKWNEKTFLKS